MIINTATLEAVNNGFNTAFLQGFNAIGSVANQYDQVVMRVPSTADLENYGWMKDLPGMREWIGARRINSLEAQGMQIHNKTWEHTLGVPVNAINDDKLGIFALAFQQQGEIVGRHPNELVWGAVLGGFTSKGFDGQYFFDTDHVGYTNAGTETSWSNTGGGSSHPWFLLDLSRTYMRPFVFQTRQAPEFVAKTRPDDEHVFTLDEILYGAKARYNAGYGFHQLAYGSKATLDPTSYEAARVALGTQYRPDGSALGVMGTHLVVGPSNEGAARRILKNAKNAAGADNEWFQTAELIVVPALG